MFAEFAKACFDRSFEGIAAFLKSELLTFTTPDQCGRWNQTLFDHVRADEPFSSDLSELHQHATWLVFPDDSPSTDGVDIVRVEIDFLTSITVVTRLWYFIERNGHLGHSVAPSRFAVRRSTRDSAIYTASFGLGLKDGHGEFWYPRTNKYYGSSDDPPVNDADWAFFESRDNGID